MNTTLQMTRAQYSKLREHISSVRTAEGPGLKFTAGSLNDGIDELDLTYIEDLVWLGIHSPWNFAQRLVSFFPQLLERL